MNAECETLELAAKSALPYAKAVFDDYILPSLLKHLGRFGQRKRQQAKVRDRAIEYLSSAYAECAYVNTIAFRNTPTRLLDIYIPLTVVDEASKKETVVDERCSLLEDYRSVLLVDGAGMGKSIIAKRLALHYVTEQKKIPVIFELRSFSKGTSFSQKLLDAIGLPEECDEDILSSVPFVFILDGLDEVALDLRKEALREIGRFRRLYFASPLLLTSRPDPCLGSLKGFLPLRVKGLREEEAFELLRKYDREGIVSKTLIKGIQSDHSPAIREFLTSPFYVSLLYCAYRHKPVIPRKKHLFYSQVYDALFESHDLTKEPEFRHKKNSGLDSTDFHRVLRRLGFWSLSNELRTEFLRDELGVILKQIEQDLPGVHFSPSAFMTDLIETVPIFIKNGNTVRWSHKALLEYFAAMFICHDTKSKQTQVLRKLYKSKSATSYLTTLELCADIDYTGFRTAVVSLLLSRFLGFVDRWKKKIADQGVKERLILERLALSFDRTFSFACLSEGIKRKFVINGKKTDLGELLDTLSKIQRSKKALRIGKAKGASYRVCLTIEPGDACLLIVVWSGVDTVILDFLADKEPGLLHVLKDEGPFPRMNVHRAFAQGSLSTNKWFFAGFSPKNILNESSQFPLVNDIFKRASQKWLDYDAAKNVYKDIQRDSSGGLIELLDTLD